MPFSKTFALLVFAGIIPILAGAFTGGLIYFFSVYNIFLAVLLVLDFIITPGPRHLEVSRVCDEKLSLGTDNEVYLRLRNNSKYFLNVELIDEVPSYFIIKNHVVKINSVPHDDTEGKYYVNPQKRGEFTFGSVHMRYKGILKLCSKKAKFNIENKYKVYPNLKDLRRYSLAALKKSQLMQGIKKTKGYAIGTEFESLREYSVGDDYRKINWMATSRSNKIIVNSYEPERNQQIFIMIDSSRVMNSEIEYIKKLDYAINSSFLLADFVIKKGDNAGLLVFDSKVRRFIKPGKGMAHFQLIAENLYNVEENFVTADYKGALLYLNENHKRRSLICVFTELFNKEEALGLVSSLKGAARNHIPLVVTIRDLRIYEMVKSGLKEQNDVYIKSAAIKMVEEREKIKKVFDESGIALLDIEPDKLSIEVLNKYLVMKLSLQI